jgi:hypothetical protein
MLPSLLACLLIFPGMVLGLGWPLASRLALDPAEKIVTGATLSLLGIFLFAWAVYVLSLPVTVLWTLPALAAAGLVSGRRSLAATLRDDAARGLLTAQTIITLWCVGWLALVLSYSGGGWAGDWWGHLQRTWLFLEHWPREVLFNSFDALTSRPPLANIANGAFLEITQRNFRHYQLFSTLLSSLAFLPAALLARRFGGARAIALLVVLFMLNPLFLQNATYPWTKLPTAFFVLTALYFFLRAHDASAPGAAGVLFSASLAGGLLTHYSTGPYAVFLALAWLGLGWPRRNEAAWWRTTAFAALAGGLLLATWFGWALMVYGWHNTFLTNTSITDQAPTAGAQLRVVALNIRDTFVPHFFRTVDFTLIAQQSSVGWWRDWFFNLYQTNFFFAFGSVVWAGILAALGRNWSGAPVSRRIFWTVFVTGTIMLGIAVHGARDTWGLAQICLQPLVLLGLARLAAGWTTLGLAWRCALVAGAALDFSLGIALQFWVQSDGLSHRFASGPSALDPAAAYSQTAQMNLYAKLHNHWVFVGDVFAPHAGLVCALLGALLLLAVFRAGRPPASSIPRS